MRNDDLLASVTEVAGSKVLPPCVVYAKLGQGGMGAVYRARHLNFDIDVAVKVLKPGLIEEDPQFVARFRREGQLAARINHQNVIRVYDVAEHVGLHYIIMELVVGETARQRVERKGPLAVGEALQILYEAAQGLGEAHRLGFVHRDIKPDNLLVSIAGQVKVADMGLAKPAIGGGGQSMLSSPNQIMGTPSYMPPEQWETTSVTAAADVWALGATFWFLLAGKDAITDPERIPARIMQRILMQPFPDIRAVRNDLPDDVVALLAKATARDAGQRFLDAAEMAAAVDQISMRRSSLRDAAGGTTELHTLVSPPPVKNLEQIKRWLREDFQTRGQISGSGSKSARTGSGREPEGEKAPLLPVPVPAPPPRPRSARWRMAAMLLLVAGGGALAYAFLFPPKGDVFAKATELEDDGEFVLAIVEVERIYTEGLGARDETRLVRLHRRETERWVGRGDYRQALEQLTTGIAAVDNDEELVGRQRELRGTVKDAAQRALQRDEPVGAVRRGERVRCRGKLALAAVQELRLAGTPVQRGADGAFDQTIDLAGAEQIAITVVLTDGAAIELDPWRIQFAAVAPALTFTKLEPVRRVEGFAVTTTSTIAVQGSLSQGDADLFVGTRKLPNVRRSNQGFVCELPVDREGRQTVTLTARKEGVPDATTELEVVRLTTGPAVQIVAPKAATTNTASVAFEVTGDEWTRKVEVTIGNMITPLERARSTNTWKATVPLLPGPNRFTVRGTNLAELVGADARGTIECTAKPASVSAKLVVDGKEQPFASDGPSYVRSANATLDVTLGGTAPELNVDGVAAKAGSIDLRSRLREGEATELVLTPRNELGNGAESRVRIVLDTQAPVVEVTRPAPGTRVPPGSALKVEGTWRDASGGADIAVDGTAAKVTADKNGGTFAVELAAPRADKTVAIRAVDRAGNETVKSIAIVVAPTEAVAVKNFPGFRSDPKEANSLGYPKVITHQATGIELVAIGLRDDAKPRFYAARRMTTAEQWEAGGGAGAKTSISGIDVVDWLRGRGTGLNLPRPAEWDALAGSADVAEATRGLAEWLEPVKETDTTYPIRKDPRGSYVAAEYSKLIGFRVVLRRF